MDFGELSSHRVSRAQRAPVRFASVRSRRGSWVRRRPRRRGRPHGPGPVGREGTGQRPRPSPSPSGRALCDGRAAMMTQIEHALSSYQITGDVPGRPSPRSATATTSSLLVERCILHSRTTVGAALSSAKCTSRRQGTPAPAADWPAAPLPGARGSAGCQNLPQRPRSGRGAREESLIFRAFLRGRSRPGWPLWQIWNDPAPDRPRSPTSTTTRPPIPLAAPTRTYGPEPTDHRSRQERLNASSARQNPPQLARCELSSTKSTPARFVRAQLAQCELR